MAAPSSRPKLLHLVREPRTHNTEARTIAKLLLLLLIIYDYLFLYLVM